MSIVSLPTGEPTCTTEDLQSISKANNFTIPAGSADEKAYLLFANGFDATCKQVEALPEYEDPRLKPQAAEGGQRKYHKPSAEENPLNAWANKTSLRLPDAKGPLSGKTIAIKDNVSVAGLPLGLGCSPDLLKDGKHPISTIDAIVVNRVLSAGGTILGTATCENFSLFPLSYTSHSGPVHNAWLPGYATGGSSSGCGALVSIADVEQARKDGRDKRDYPMGEGADMGIGGDQGGSIRLPAAYSGIYGLKPTHGLVPYTGIASLCPLIDHTGPMTRTVEDAALLLSVIAGWDGIDPRTTPNAPNPVPDYLSDLQKWIDLRKKDSEWTPTTSAKGLRIGILEEAFSLPSIHPDIKETVQKAADRFTTLGATVKKISIPIHLQAAAIWTAAIRPLIPHFLTNNPAHLLSHPLPHLDIPAPNQQYFETLAAKNPAVVNVLLNATLQAQRYGPPLVRKAHQHIWELKAAYDAAFEDVDVLLTPMTPTVGPKHPKLREGGIGSEVMDIMDPAIGATINTCGFNLTGHPAMSMPVGWGKVPEGEGRLPVGMQLVGKMFAEGMLFKAAKAWEVGGSWMDE